MTVYIDDGPNVGLSQNRIGFSNDGVNWQGLTKTNLNVKSVFTPGTGRNIAVNYPHTNSCIVVLQGVDFEINFDIQDVANQPWTNAVPSLTGPAELSLAVNTINAW